MSDQPKVLQHIAYTPEQAATVTGRSRSRIYKAIKDKELTARKDGKATLIEDAELRRWVSNMPIINAQERPMTGFFAGLSEAQKKDALAYRGEEAHGDPSSS